MSQRNQYPHPSGWPAQYPQPAGPLFQVRVMKHTGMVLLWLNQRRTVTGTYAQCEAAIKQAQLHNLLAGWWSILSVLLINWIALGVNWHQHDLLRRQAEQARAQADHWARQQGYGAQYPR